MPKLELSDTARDALATALALMINGGRLSVFERRGDVTPIGVLRFGRQAFSPARGGVINVNEIENDYASRPGALTWAVVTDSDDNMIFECDVGESNAMLIMDRSIVQKGSPISVKSLTIKMPRSRE
jgi:hypothetical protein